jgi:hypothetical protein
MQERDLRLAEQEGNDYKYCLNGYFEILPTS